MKKKRIAYLTLSLMLLLGTGGIYAAKQEAINNVDTGVVNIEIDEYIFGEISILQSWKYLKSFGTVRMSFGITFCKI